MELETKRLILRDHISSDWEDIHEYAKIPEFSQYDFWGPNSIEDSKNFVEQNVKQALEKNRYKSDLAVVYKENKKVIGGVGIRRASEKSNISDLGYAINPNFQSKGLASEAVRGILEFAFNELKLALVFATCDTRNIASYKVMEKCGMKRVGEIKKHKEFKGAWRDSYRYETLNYQF